MSFFGGLKSFFGGKQTTTTTNQGLDPQSQAYVDQMRQQSQGGANTALNGPGGGGSWFTGPQTMSIGDQAAQFFNPYMKNVVNATQGQYDQLRSQAAIDSNQHSTLNGAFGGTRAAVAQGARLGQLDVGQANTVSNLLNSGYQNALGMGTQYAEQQRQLQQQQMQEPLYRQQLAQQFQQGGLGPVGSTSTQTQSSQGGGFGDLLKGAAGLAATYFGAGGKNPFGGGGGGLQIGGQVPQGYMPGQQPNLFQGQYPGNYGPYR